MNEPRNGLAEFQFEGRPDDSPLDFILRRDRAEPVIQVTPTPQIFLGDRRIAEDAEQDERIKRAVFGEVGLVEAEGDRDAGHQPMTERRERGHVFQNRLAQLDRFVGEEVGAMERNAGPHERMIARELLTEVEPLYTSALASARS